VALMGQNGAGKTTIFNLILGDLKPKEGQIFMTPKDARIGHAQQVIARADLDKTVREWFAGTFAEVPYNLDKRIGDALDAVNLKTDLAKKLRQHSGGQQARLLLAYALIQDPDILLLDEPTNNLDQTGIEHLTGFLTDGVLYLDSHTKKVEQYVGNYFNVVEEISKRIEREQMQNARAEAEIRKKMAQAEVFAHKGGKLRSVAKKMREYAEEMEEGMVDVRKEDKTIRPFAIPLQEFPFEFNGKILEVGQVGILKEGEPVTKDLTLVMRKGTHVLISGPNGIGKSTLLRRIVAGTAPGIKTGEGVRVGYYSQDFSSLDHEAKAYDVLASAMDKPDEQKLRSTAAGFLLDGKALGNKVDDLSEGQKGLLLFTKLTLMKPGLLVLDEPTNHINFRHLPVIAKALDEYAGALLMVSHIPDFVSQIRIDETIDLSAL
jgi:ATP-binding cassette subfamily F protein 3